MGQFSPAKACIKKDKEQFIALELTSLVTKQRETV
jgi:hypothetical protein